MNVKITVHVPHENVEAVLQAIADTGAGTIGEYTSCSFSYVGLGRFKPTGSAKPYVGRSGSSEAVEETCIEVVCSRDEAKHAIAAIKQVSPYEEPAIIIVPVLEESEL